MNWRVNSKQSSQSLVHNDEQFSLLVHPFTHNRSADLLSGVCSQGSKESTQGTSPVASEGLNSHTQLMRTNLGRPELGSFTLQKAYITFPLLSSSTSSSRPPSAESQEGSEAACTPAHWCRGHFYISAHSPHLPQNHSKDEHTAQWESAWLAHIRSSFILQHHQIISK